jgi:hypothetical protein
MAHKRSLLNEDTESKLICDIDSENYVEDTVSDEDEDYYDEEKQPSPSVQRKHQEVGTAVSD